jgi:hypothetical protein
MEERNRKENPEILSAQPGGEDATDIVGPTGEEMPLAMHDQGHTTFDPRLDNRRPKAQSQ